MRIPFFSYVKENVWDMEGVISTAGSATAAIYNNSYTQYEQVRKACFEN